MQILQINAFGILKVTIKLPKKIITHGTSNKAKSTFINAVAGVIAFHNINPELVTFMTY